MTPARRRHVIGRIGLAMIPGLPEFRLDPDLTLLLFLPPLNTLEAELDLEEISARTAKAMPRFV
jgi:hypothetical protein